MRCLTIDRESSNKRHDFCSEGYSQSWTLDYVTRIIQCGITIIIYLIAHFEFRTWDEFEFSSKNSYCFLDFCPKNRLIFQENSWKNAIRDILILQFPTRTFVIQHFSHRLTWSKNISPPCFSVKKSQAMGKWQGRKGDTMVHSE